MKVKQLKGQPVTQDYEYILVGIVAIVVLLVIVGWFNGVPDRADRDYLQQNGCEITHREPTGRYFSRGTKQLWEFETVTYTCRTLAAFQRTVEVRR